jgi:hypothetical protein
MSDLNLDATQSTPAITTHWNEGLLVMRGDSYPENSYEFFAPLFAWVRQYLDDTQTPLQLELHLLYLNTSSVKAMMDIFDLLEEAHESGRDVTVKWFYDRDNERVAELAEEFKEDCTFSFAIVPLDR